jgi:hypothetical protein
MHNFFDIATTILLLSLGITWSKKEPINVVVKIIMIFLSIIGIFVIMNSYGYVIKIN